MLELLTFTGVDELTPLDELVDLAARYDRRVEFAALVGNNTGAPDHPKYPPLFDVRAFRDVGAAVGMPTAIHLCGWYAQVLMREPNGSEEFIYELCDGFGRVQVNLPEGTFDPYNDEPASYVYKFASNVSCEGVVLQHRHGWDSLPVAHPKIEYLFDKSGGKGINSFSEWPNPPGAGLRVGYSGGIGPETISEAMKFVKKHEKARIWFDMESKVRTNDRFDLEKVEKVCINAFETVQDD